MTPGVERLGCRPRPLLPCGRQTWDAMLDAHGMQSTCEPPRCAHSKPPSPAAPAHTHPASTAHNPLHRHSPSPSGGCVWWSFCMRPGRPVRTYVSASTPPPATRGCSSPTQTTWPGRPSSRWWRPGRVRGRGRGGEGEGKGAQHGPGSAGLLCCAQCRGGHHHATSNGLYRSAGGTVAPWLAGASLMMMLPLRWHRQARSPH